MQVPGARVDRWLWAVRLTPTRAAASSLCRAGHVRVNGALAKASTSVRPGDTVVVRRPGREHVVEVVTVIDRRVGASEAAACLLGRSPPAPARTAEAPVAARDPASGRPTKRDRRRTDRLRGR